MGRNDEKKHQNIIYIRLNALELGSVLYKLGQRTEARSTFKKVIAMDGIVFGHDDKAMEWLKRLDEEGH